MEVTQLKGDRDRSVHKCSVGRFEKRPLQFHTGMEVRKHVGVNTSCI